MATLTSESYPASTDESGRILFVRSESVPGDFGDKRDSLWVLDLDGGQMRPLTEDEVPGIGYHAPEDRSSALVFASATEVALDTERVRQVTIPEACCTPPNPEGQEARLFGFRFSPSGRYLSFTVGGASCGGAGVRVLDRETGACFDIADHDRLLRWLSDERALVALEQCEYGTVSLYDLATERSALLGPGTVVAWNRERTAFFATVSDRVGWADVLWAYNVQADAHIHEPPQGDDEARPDTVRAEYGVGWAPDGMHLLYARRALSYTYDLTSSALLMTTFGPLQLRVVDDLGRQDRRVVGDSAHNYFARGWDGKHVIVQRTPYQTLSVPAGLIDGDAVECPLYGKECSDVEYFLLDWRTGELTPTVAPQTPAVAPSPEVAAPDLGNAPVYETPDGEFALYVGKDGEGLWRVSASGEQTLLVEDGHHFVYVQP
jgi:hypothetical protein